MYDVVIMGAGPGGYVAALRAVQLGLKVALLEREEVGGVCLNWGCIPSKALLRNAEVVSLVKNASQYGISLDNLHYDFAPAVDRSRQVVKRLVSGVRFLLKRGKVDLIMGEAYLASPNKVVVRQSGQELETKNVIVATGARPKSLPGLEIDRQRIITSREALELRQLPSSIVIVGAGPLGMEFAYLYSTYGVQTTILEMLPHALPLEDQEISEVLERAMQKQGVKILTQSRVQSVEMQEQKAVLHVSTPSGEQQIEAEKVLLAAGVQPNSDEIGLESVGITTQRGFISIDDKMATNVPGIYAIGDVTGKLQLAHVAMAQGVIAVETIAGRETRALGYQDMPRATYCRPQVASLGQTEAQAKESGQEIKVGKFPFRANGKALAMNEDEGFVKIVADARYGEILGVHMIGGEVTELLAEGDLSRLLECTVEELGATVVAHPTLSEAVKEAALAVQGEAIHA
ncbi:MAG: dihydrolipoyl dehydrogenase [Chloroflexota bacterium]|nr:MAG: dihydrolipoyl dehydrogenase [Chloroflexota bacterium]